LIENEMMANFLVLVPKNLYFQDDLDYIMKKPHRCGKGEEVGKEIKISLHKTTYV